jgi:hypothetical protein
MGGSHTNIQVPSKLTRVRVCEHTQEGEGGGAREGDTNLDTTALDAGMNAGGNEDDELKQTAATDGQQCV